MASKLVSLTQSSLKFASSGTASIVVPDTDNITIGSSAAVVLDVITAPTPYLDMNEYQIKRLAEPTAGTDATTKDYVDLRTSAPGPPNFSVQFNNGAGTPALEGNSNFTFAAGPPALVTIGTTVLGDSIIDSSLNASLTIRANGTGKLTLASGTSNSIEVSTANQLSVLQTTDSTSTSTGSLITAGGLGVAKSLFTGKMATIQALAGESVLTLKTTNGSAAGAAVDITSQPYALTTSLGTVLWSLNPSGTGSNNAVYLIEAKLMVSNSSSSKVAAYNLTSVFSVVAGAETFVGAQEQVPFSNIAAGVFSYTWNVAAGVFQLSIFDDTTDTFQVQATVTSRRLIVTA